MGEDMTYADAEPTRAQLAARVAELEADWVDKNDVLMQSLQVMEAAEEFKQRAETAEVRVAELERENAELRARLDAVPVEKLTLADGAIAIKLTPEQSERLRPLVAQVWGVPCDEFGLHYGLVLGQAQGFSGKNGDLTVATFRFVDHAITCEIEDIVRRYGVGVQCTQVADDTDAPLKLATVEDDE